MLLADFAPSVWALCLLYIALLAIALLGCTPSAVLLLGFDLIWYVSSIYLAWRVLLHSTTLRQGARR